MARLEAAAGLAGERPVASPATPAVAADIAERVAAALAKIDRALAEEE